MIKGNFILAGWLLVLILCFKPFDAISQISIDIEAGAVYTGYNDVRIPGDEGSFISFSDELNGKTSLFSRVRLGYMFGDRNEVLLLYAPLNLSYKGTVSRDIIFKGETFAAGSKLNATYKFNSYRITYRYHVLKKNKLGGGSEKVDLGVVPLISFIAHWQPTEQFGLVLDGDALAAPQGRAEDVLLAVTYKATSRLTFRAGYRILEGGADNATVYTFSLFHYAVAGLTVKL